MSLEFSPYSSSAFATTTAPPLEPFVVDLTYNSVQLFTNSAGNYFYWELADDALFTAGVRTNGSDANSSFALLNALTTYYVRVAFADAAYTATSGFSSVLQFTTTAQSVAAPLNLSIVSKTQTTAELACDPCPARATLVRWEVATDALFTTTFVNSQQTNGISLGALTPNTTYYARAYYTEQTAGYNGADISPASAVFSWITLALPPLAKPVIVLSRIDDPSQFPGVPPEYVGILMQATAYQDYGFTILYQWEVMAGNQQGGGGSGGTQGVGTFYAPAAARGTTHGYRVTASYAGGSSPASDIFYVTIPAPRIAAGPYEAWQPTLAPPWLQRPNGLSANAALGYVKDLAVYDILETVLQALPQYADEFALGLLTSDHNLERYPIEGSATLRARLLGAWRFWQQAGTAPGVIEAMRQLGYLASILELRTVDITKWSEFIVIIRALPGRTLGADWGGTPNAWGQPAGALWGSGVTEQDLYAIRRLLRKVKPAHTFIPNLYIVTGGVLWGESAATWGSASTNWGGGGTVTIAGGIGGIL